MSVQRDGVVTPHPPADFVLEYGDVLGYSATIGTVCNLWTKMGHIAATPPGALTGTEYAHRLAEAVVAPSSRYIGRKYGDIETGAKKIVAVSRRREDLSQAISEDIVQPGDLLVMEVEAEWLDESHEDDLLLIAERRGYRVQRVSKAAAAAAIVGAMVLLSAFGVMSLLNAALLAAVALIGTGCLSFREAWRSIDWQTYVVLAAAVGLEPAVTESGLAVVISDALGSMAGESIVVSLIVVYIGSIVLTNLVTNAAAAALMFPITAAIVASLGTGWEPFVIVLMLGCSYAFINPAGYQTSLMVMKPGGYTFTDFVRVGVPLTVLVGAVAVSLALLVYPT